MSHDVSSEEVRHTTTDPPAAEDSLAASSSRIRFHELLIRESDDDPNTAVVGRADGHEFIELPSVGAAAIRALDAADSIQEAESHLEAEHGVRVDLVDLVTTLTDVGLVRSIDQRRLDLHESATKRTHLPWLKAAHVRWMFGRTAKLAYGGLVLAAVATLATHPSVLPAYQDFFWTSYVGLAVLINTALFVGHASLHEVMHLAAARSLGAPARIGLGTRLHSLVLQTDVTAVWGTPRRFRYRVYLAGLCWDLFVVCTAFLLLAHLELGALTEGLLSALVLAVLFSAAAQTQMYKRTDLYFVLLDVLRCRDLFHDGLAYFRYLLQRTRSLLRRTSEPRPADPTADFAARERKAVRIYAVALVMASLVDIGIYAFFGIPILVETFARALSQIFAGAAQHRILPAIDGTLVMAVEGTLLLLFLVAFIRGHRHWFRRRSATRDDGQTITE